MVKLIKLEKNMQTIFEIIRPLGKDKTKLEGDQLISGRDNLLWSLTYHVLTKYQTPIRFKYFEANVPAKQNNYLLWLVPAGDKYHEIARFIYNELKEEIRDEKIFKIEDEEIFNPGLHMNIMPFTGDTLYTEKEEFQKYILPKINNYFKEKIDEQMNRDFSLNKRILRAFKVLWRGF